MKPNSTLREDENTRYLLEQIDKTCNAYSAGEQTKDEIKWLVEGHIESLIEDTNILIQRKQLDELELLKRLNLEFNVVVCDCGEPYKDTDPHNLIKKRLAELTKELKETV